MINAPIKNQWLQRISITHVLIIGLVFRLIAVFFSKGYAFHDDHFEMAELVERWRQGYSFLWTGSDVHVFSLVYPGFLYLVFEACHRCGLHEPEQILFVLRLIHALFSLLAIYYSYKLALRIAGEEKTAILVAIAVALFWIFPFMSVRNLREFVCVPFLLAGCYYIADPKFSYRAILIAGLLFALAFTIRLQILFIPFGIGLTLLFQKETRKKAILFGVFLGIGFMLTQGLFDLIYYRNPFASIAEYLRFNSDKTNIDIQPTGPWYQYLETLAGVFFLLPFFLLLLGYIKSWKIKPARMFFWGSLLFFAFHSYYRNKQERFIIPFIPFFILLGIIGFYEYYKEHKRDKWLRNISRIAIGWFIVFNTIGLVFLCFSYTKKERVGSMLYLKRKGDVSNIIMESENGAPRPPVFYLGKQINFYTLTAGDSIPALTLYIPGGPDPEPNYLIMSGEENLEKRLSRLQRLYPLLKFEKEIHPGFLDNIAYRLNPKHNDNEVWRIYKIR